MTDTGDLEHRLALAESTLAAIRRGGVDAVVVDGDGGQPVLFTLEGADAFYRSMVEQLPEGAAAVNLRGDVLYANAAFADMFARRPGSLVGGDLLDLGVEPAAADELLAATTEERSVDISLTGPSGERISLALSARVIEPGPDGALCVVAVDLTQRDADQTAVRQAEERFRSAFAHAPIGIALLDHEGNAERVNASLCSILGRDADGLLGRPLPWFQSLTDVQGALAALSDGGPPRVTLEREGRHGTGRTVWADLHISAVRDEHDTVQHYIVQVQDVSERREHEQRLRHVADHDNLTGLLNRRGFEIAMNEHLAVAHRYGVQGALILLDVDHFKYINDARGHQVGDLVLIGLAEALRARLRDSDLLARLGGDEFAVLLPRGNADSALLVAEQIVRTARELQIAELTGLRQLTVSAGVAMVDTTKRSAGELMGLADLAMYDAKEAGRDGVSIYDPMTGDGSETELRMTWLLRIQQAIDGGELAVHAQPIVDLRTGEVAARELLARLPGADGIPVPAATWFDIAERYDLATAIDQWVFTQAAAMLRADPDAPAFNVNVSATSIRRETFLEHIRATAVGFDTSRLTLEITETAAIGNISAAARFAEEVHGLGLRLALDDFGAGFGSFYYLKHLPFDDIKIDGEFVRDSVNDERDRTIIRAMVDVARATGRCTVAEAIEDEATLALMRDHGVDFAQGYHLGRPEPL